MRTRLLLLLLAVFVQMTTTTAQTPFRSYTGDKTADAWSPGWVPYSGYIMSSAICTQQPPPYGGQAVGIGIKHYSSCGFPYNGHMYLDTYWAPEFMGYIIFAGNSDVQILTGKVQASYLAGSDCDTPSPYYGQSAIYIIRDDWWGC